MDIYVKPYIYPATDSFKEIRVYKFFRKVGPRKYELLPGYEGWGFSSKAKAEKRAREEEERIRKEEEAQLGIDELEEVAWSNFERGERLERGRAIEVRRALGLE